MDYEKAYDEALERARGIINYYKEHNRDESSIEDLQEIFPELKESEDEMIRKELIFYLGDMPEDTELRNGVTNRDVLVWLEKQGEQPSEIRWYDASLIPQEMEELLVEWDSEDATWHEIAFYHADTKTFWNGTRQVENVTRWCYILDLLEKQGKQKPTSDTRYEVKVGDSLSVVNGKPFDYEKATITQKDFAPINDTDEGIVEASKEYREMRERCGIKDPIMLDEIEEAYYEGAISRKSVAWSYEDENYLQSAENACEYQYGKNTSTILWLKSLKCRMKGKEEL